MIGRAAGRRRGFDVARYKVVSVKNGGFARSRQGTVPPGTIIDSYGKPNGYVAGRPGDTASQRGLPVGPEARPYRQYEVMKRVPATIGTARAVRKFGAAGGRQYTSQETIEELVRKEILREL